MLLLLLVVIGPGDCDVVDAVDNDDVVVGGAAAGIVVFVGANGADAYDVSSVLIFKSFIKFKNLALLLVYETLSVIITPI